MTSRQSWDTTIKHLVRHGVLQDVLTTVHILQVLPIVRF